MIRTLAVAFPDETGAAELARAASAIAAQFDSHLTATCSMPDYVSYRMGLYDIPSPLIMKATLSHQAAAERIRKLLEAGCETAGVRCEWRRLARYGESLGFRTTEMMQAADAVIARQPGRNEDSYLTDYLIRNSGRPLLMIPNGWTKRDIGRRCLVGWSPTREATRALFDAIEFMQPNGELTLVHFPSDDLFDEAPMHALATVVNRHDIRVNIMQGRRDHRRSVASQLLERAEEIGPDFVASGAFGHTAMYDLVVGAATRELMQTANLPVLFAK